MNFAEILKNLIPYIAVFLQRRQIHAVSSVDKFTG